MQRPQRLDNAWSPGAVRRIGASAAFLRVPINVLQFGIREVEISYCFQRVIELLLDLRARLLDRVLMRHRKHWN